MLPSGDDFVGTLSFDHSPVAARLSAEALVRRNLMVLKQSFASEIEGVNLLSTASEFSKRSPAVAQLLKHSIGNCKIKDLTLAADRHR
jgi:hypothetical protein